MARNLTKDSRMCLDVDSFFKCYENPGIPCDARIYTDFLKVIKNVGELLLKMFKEKKGLMPNC
jgi:hypothetical protein